MSSSPLWILIDIVPSVAASECIPEQAPRSTVAAIPPIAPHSVGCLLVAASYTTNKNALVHERRTRS